MPLRLGSRRDSDVAEKGRRRGGSIKESNSYRKGSRNRSTEESCPLSSHIHTTMDQLVTMASDFFAEDRHRHVPSLDHNASEDDDSSSCEIRSARQTHGDLLKRHPSMVSPTSTPPRSCSASSSSSSSCIRPSPSSVVLAHRSTPMARMRNVQVREASLLPPSVPSPPRKTGEQVIQDKHAKWRRHMQRVAKEREAKRIKQRDQPSSVLCSAPRPSTLLQRLLTANCTGELQVCTAVEDGDSVTDSLSRSYSEEESSDENPEEVLTQRNGKLVIPTTNRLYQPDQRLESDDKAQEFSEQDCNGANNDAKSVGTITDKNFIQDFIHVSVFVVLVVS
jgi:hypothetical protein